MTFSAVRYEAQKIFRFSPKEHLAFSIPFLLEGKFDCFNYTPKQKICQILPL